jgi:hypothetical protein
MKGDRPFLHNKIERPPTLRKSDRPYTQTGVGVTSVFLRIASSLHNHAPLMILVKGDRPIFKLAIAPLNWRKQNIVRQTLSNIYLRGFDALAQFFRGDHKLGLKIFQRQHRFSVDFRI